MSSSTRYYQPRCSACFKANIRNKLLGLPYKSWTQIEFIRSTGFGAILQCKICGHKWRSYSKFATNKAYEMSHLITNRSSRPQKRVAVRGRYAERIKG